MFGFLLALRCHGMAKWPSKLYDGEVGGLVVMFVNKQSYGKLRPDVGLASGSSRQSGYSACDMRLLFSYRPDGDLEYLGKVGRVKDREDVTCNINYMGIQPSSQHQLRQGIKKKRFHQAPSNSAPSPTTAGSSSFSLPNG
jgi:hypothetical protein